MRRRRGEGLSARADDGPLAAFGRWLAPAASAKSFLRSSVIVSPDGSRVYAIGVKEGVENPEISGSAGVFVFDAATLELIGIYQPTADFVSLAIGADGRFVYAAGLPGVDALGRRARGPGRLDHRLRYGDGSVRADRRPARRRAPLLRTRTARVTHRAIRPRRLGRRDSHGAGSQRREEPRVSHHDKAGAKKATTKKAAGAKKTTKK